MCLVLLLAYMSFEELANFSREKESVAFVTGRLFSFLLVLSHLFGDTNINV